ncbi:MAG TPA: glycine cleavage system protein T, partial [Microbacterium sp.]|nr:glycine cleavage system protein T [Microbacterium sp.]
LIWNPDDVAAAQRSLLEPGLPAKYIDFPKARYGLYQVDRVLIDGHDVGISHDAGYITNEQVFASLASLVPDAAEPGTEVVVVWG